MPWSPGDSVRFKKGLSSDESRNRWASIANSVLSDTGDEGKAIRIANSKTKGSSPLNRDTVGRKMNRLGHPR